jgi:hypothetical protein
MDFAADPFVSERVRFFVFGINRLTPIFTLRSVRYHNPYV